MEREHVFTTITTITSCIDSKALKVFLVKLKTFCRLYYFTTVSSLFFVFYFERRGDLLMIAIFKGLVFGDFYARN